MTDYLRAKINEVRALLHEIFGGVLDEDAINEIAQKTEKAERRRLFESRSPPSR